MRWIHISDIHFNPSSDTSKTLRSRNNLVPFLKKEQIQADYLLITGDFRHALKQKNQDQNTVINDALCYVLDIAKAAHIPYKNILIIPGNHDYQRFSKKRLERLNGLREKYIESMESFSAEDMTFLNVPFSFFVELCRELRQKVPDIKMPWIETENNLLPWTCSELYNDFSIILLNTCFFCHSNNDRKGNLIIDTAKLYNQVQQVIEHNPGKPIIILAHHGMDTLDQKIQRELDFIFHEINEQVLYLCGDAHDLWIRRVNRVFEVTTGCLLEATGVKTMFSIGEIGNNRIMTIKAYRSEDGIWGEYSQFNALAQDYLKEEQTINPLQFNNSTEDEKEKSIIEKIIESKNKDVMAYSKIIAQPYGLLITDITGVLFDINEAGKEDFPRDIVITMANLAKRHISICFTTGRGRTGARHLLFNLAQKVIQTDPVLSWTSISDEWACITHNGAFLLTTPDKSKSGFLANEEKLFPDKHGYIERHIDLTFIQKKFEIMIEEIKCRKKLQDVEKIVFKISKEPVSVRFSFENGSDELYCFLFDAIGQFCQKYIYDDKYSWYLTRGRFEQKEVFEYSIVNKSDAVKDYINRYRPIDMSNIIRLADAGQPGGSDYSFLTDGPSFSVGNITEERVDTCFPVINGRGEVLLGTKATVFLLNTLRFYSSLCIKSVYDKNQYKMSFSNAIGRAKKRSEEIFSFYNTRLAWMDFLYEDTFSNSNISRIFDVKSGAILFSDYEWTRIEIMIGNSTDTTTLSEQIRCFSSLLTEKCSKDNKSEKPNLKYFMHTDTHVLFRGYLYYYFLKQTNDSPQNTDQISINQWINIFQGWYQEAQAFIKKFLQALKNYNNRNNIPMGYLIRKLIIGGLDNIRNILLVLDYFYLRQYVLTQEETEYDFLIQITDSGNPLLDQCEKISSLLSNCLSQMYALVFETQIESKYTDNTISLLSDVLSFLKIRQNDYNYLNNSKTRFSLQLFPNNETNRNNNNAFFTDSFPRWRESDCFIESVAALELFLSKLPDTKKRLMFWGIPYGSLEHPILANILSKKHGFEVTPTIQYIILHDNYENRHRDDFKLTIKEVGNNTIVGEEGDSHVLIDDTMTTGTTLDLGVKSLALNNIYINSIIVMRYAGLNRLNHYLTNSVDGNSERLNASAPDVTKLFSVIHGLITEAPYSKLQKYGLKEEKPYEDTLGVFDKAKNRIKNYLYTNYENDWITG